MRTFTHISALLAVLCNASQCASRHFAAGVSEVANKRDFRLSLQAKIPLSVLSLAGALWGVCSAFVAGKPFVTCLFLL